MGIVSTLVEKLETWAAEHLSAREEGLLYTLHPHLTPPRLAVAFEQERGGAGGGPSPSCASLPETFASLQEGLDEFARSLPEDERQSLNLALLGEQDPRPLLRFLLSTS